MAEPGEGGPGHSWFAVELTTEHVEPGAFPWPEEPPVVEVTAAASVPDTGQFVRAGKLVIETERRVRVRVVRREETTVPARVGFPSRPLAGRALFTQAIEGKTAARVEFNDDNELLLMGVL